MRTPSASSINRSADRSVSSTTARALPTAAHAISARCQRSWWLVSATETLQLLRSDIVNGLMTLRLSLSDWQPSRWSSQVCTATTTSDRSRSRGLERALHLFHAVRLDPVAHLEIVEVLDPDTALEALAHLADVVLEALEAGEIARIDHRPVAD